MPQGIHWWPDGTERETANPREVQAWHQTTMENDIHLKSQYYTCSVPLFLEPNFIQHTAWLSIHSCTLHCIHVVAHTWYLLGWGQLFWPSRCECADPDLSTWGISKARGAETWTNIESKERFVLTIIKDGSLCDLFLFPPPPPLPTLLPPSRCCSWGVQCLLLLTGLSGHRGDVLLHKAAKISRGTGIQLQSESKIVPCYCNGTLAGSRHGIGDSKIDDL